MAMGGYDHAKKTMRQQARAAQERRDRARATRSDASWADGSLSRTPSDATCTRCGSAESFSRLQRSEAGLICHFCASTEQTRRDLRQEVRDATLASVIWVVLALIAVAWPVTVLVGQAYGWIPLPDATVWPPRNIDTWTNLGGVLGVVAGALGLFAVGKGLRDVGRQLRLRKAADPDLLRPLKHHLWAALVAVGVGAAVALGPATALWWMTG